jgi:hypothetical protein
MREASVSARTTRRVTAAMLIGDSITYRGRRYVVAGVTPASVRPAQVELHDPETNETHWVAWPFASPEKPTLRLLRKNSDRA